MRNSALIGATCRRSRFVRLILTVTTLLWASIGSTEAQQTPARQPVGSDSSQTFDTPPLLQPGDVVLIRVWRQPELSGEFDITGRGTIGHPLFSRVEAAGRELTDIEEDLHVLLTRYLGEPRFVVEGLVRVAVGGEVNSPDVYALTTQTSIAEAIAEAGGPTQRGRLDRVVVNRGGQPYVVDLTGPNVHLSDLDVRSGDQIVIERHVDVLREYVVPFAAIVAALATSLRFII